MRHGITCALFLALASSAAGGDKKFESKDGKFAAAFPGEAISSPQKVDGLEMTVTFAAKGETVFVVIHMDLPADAVKDFKTEKALLPVMSAGLTKVTKSDGTTFGKQKYPAHEITGEMRDTHLRATLILADKRLYQVVVYGTKDVVGGKAADAFIASFEITK